MEWRSERRCPFTVLFFIEEFMRFKLLLVAAAPMLFAAAVVQAQGRRGGGPGGGPPGGGPGGRCFGTADSLSDAQKSQVRTLSEAYMQAHKPQLDSLRAIMDASRAARQSGQSQDAIRAIMEQGKPLGDALAPFRKQFGETVVTYLTPAQLAQGCVPPAPGGPPPGGRRGGPPPGPPGA
jgi:Spy/CpxP family protein refolding chaperone